MRQIRFPLLLTLLLLQMIPAAAQYRQKYPLMSAPVPAALGVNIHFTDPRPGEIQQITKAGFRWIRMDLVWAGVERTRGQYDFAAYDRLMAALDRSGIRPIFILDYGNDLYQEGSPRSDEARAGFARFAAAAVTHFRGRGIVWEMWNEPNGTFWLPRADADEYVALAAAVGQAIRRVGPEEWFVGPATSGMDFAFFEKCFRGGLLQYWDAVSFHPYRNTPPETAAPDFQRTRELIARYAPPGKQIPILNSEWGYSEKYPGLDIEKQSDYIARQALVNMANGLAISIWYDWHDDGVDPKEPEHHFGTVTHDYQPKPAYRAISTLTSALAECRYSKRLALASPDDYCLLFQGSKGPRLAVWTTAAVPHSVRIPASAGTFQVVDKLGATTRLAADNSGLQLAVTGSPQYAVPQAANAILDLAARWNGARTVPISSPAEALTALAQALDGAWTAADRSLIAGTTVDAQGRTADGRLALPPGGDAASTRAALEAYLRAAGLGYNAETPNTLRIAIRTTGGQSIEQSLELTSAQPLRLTPEPARGQRLPVRIENPTGRPFDGRIRVAGSAESEARPFRFRQDQLEQRLELPIAIRPGGGYSAGLRVERRFAGSSVWSTVASAPDTEYKMLDDLSAFAPGTPLPVTGYRVVPDGSAAVASTIDAAIVAPPRGLDRPEARALRIAYTFSPGWKFLRLAPPSAMAGPLPRQPFALGAWVHGDGSGDVLNARFTDSTGQTFQPTAGRIDWRGWRFVTFSLRGIDSGRWGGADDGAVHYPIHIDTLLLVDSPGGRGGKGTVYATAFTLITR